MYQAEYHVAILDFETVHRLLYSQGFNTLPCADSLDHSLSLLGFLVTLENSKSVKCVLLSSYSTTN